MVISIANWEITRGYISSCSVPSTWIVDVFSFPIDVLIWRSWKVRICVLWPEGRTWMVSYFRVFYRRKGHVLPCFIGKLKENHRKMVVCHGILWDLLSGKLLHNELEYHFQWLNYRFLWWFFIANCKLSSHSSSQYFPLCINLPQKKSSPDVRWNL